MARKCNDAEMGNCTGRAYQRKGFAWWLCKLHWREMLSMLAWAGQPTKYDEATK